MTDPNSIEYTAHKIIASISLFKLIGGAIAGVILSFIVPIGSFLTIVGVLIFADLIAGVIAAKHRKEEIRSKAIGRTVHKFILYFTAILVSRGIAYVFAPQMMIDNMYLTWIISGTICLRELKSVFENVEQVTGVPLSSRIDLFEKLFNSKEKKDD